MDIDNTSPRTKNTKSDNKFSRYFLPDYLVKNYWWAYLSPMGVNFFDRGFMVNRILWGQYHKIAENTVNLIAKKPEQTVAGISCAYGEFFPKLMQNEQVSKLYLFDIAPIQLTQIMKKVPQHVIDNKCQLFLSDASNIAIQHQCVDTAVLFFLLHELPTNVRAQVLVQAIRIIKPNGRLVITDYAHINQHHLFHKNMLFRSIFEKMEPFLADFWRCDLINELEAQAKNQGRKITLTSKQYYFKDFYRLLEFTVD
jgi:ubiquinone/menaquinone biosynthesis C-methylase UbiE